LVVGTTQRSIFSQENILVPILSVAFNAITFLNLAYPAAARVWVGEKIEFRA
jgi:hypothetical protein